MPKKLELNPAEQRVRDFAVIVQANLEPGKLSFRGQDASRQRLKRMAGVTGPWDENGLKELGRAVWRLVNEETKQVGRKEMIANFWQKLIKGLWQRFPWAGTPLQWIELQELRGEPAAAKLDDSPWKSMQNRILDPPLNLSLPEATAAALDPYRAQIIKEFHEISLSGFGDVGAQVDHKGRAELARVYIDLVFKQTGETRSAARGERSGEPDDGHPVGLRALEGLARHPRVVIIGLPGSGKSTLLKFFSVCLARFGQSPVREWSDHLNPWPPEEMDLLPVFVELRQFAASIIAPVPREVAGGQHLTDYILAQLKPSPLEKCGPALMDALAAGRAIVFLDGLDEVPDDDQLRPFVLKTVAAFAAGPFQASRIIVTCRPRSYDDPAWQLPGFERLDLAALDEPRISRFISQFYAEVARRDERVAAVKNERIAKLQLAVRLEELRELAVNPFMLTVMAWLHRFKELPGKRALILDCIVDQLLFKWEEEKRRDDGSGPALLVELLRRHDVEPSSLRRVLCRLAFQTRQKRFAVANQTSAFAVSIPKSQLLAALKELPDPEKVSKDNRESWALAVIQVIDRRTGILVPEGGDSFIMPYKLQEFLAGEYLTYDDELETVAQSMSLVENQRCFECVAAALIGSDGYWEEVVKWSAAIQAHTGHGRSKGKARDLASELSDPGQLQNTTGVRRAVVAGEILWEVGINEIKNSHPVKGPECLQRVRRKLTAIILDEEVVPNLRAAAGAARGWLEDLPPGMGLDQGLPDLSWCQVHQGPFIMGGKKSWEGGCILKPSLPNDFWISRFPVTVAQFQAFVDDGGYVQEECWQWSKEARQWHHEMTSKWRSEESKPGPEDYDLVFQTPNHPRVGVSWFEAVAFCRWLTRKLGLERVGEEIRLPSEIEWERAARGTKARPWPWGSDGANLERYCNCGHTKIGHTSAVGIFPAGDTPKEDGDDGIADLAGNVWEWCGTKWRRVLDSKLSNDLDGNEVRVMRGGSWGGGGPGDLSPSSRGSGGPGYRDCVVGFRVVRAAVSGG